jgi:predicted RNA-binding Zn ribbon-like protein
MTRQEYTKRGFGQPALWIDFLNSLEHNGLGHSEDHLRNPDWVKSFVHHWKLTPRAHQPVPFASLAQLRRLLRDSAGKLNSSSPLGNAELRALNVAMSVLAHPQLIQRQNGFVLEESPRQKDWRWVQAKIAESFAQTLAERPADRVKICPDPLCRWVFYDRTKGKTRLWCNEKTCGNRNRVRRARAAIKKQNE